MIDYSKWPRKKILTRSLKLDTLNPRLSGFGNAEPTQTQIIEYMVEHENIVGLAKNISKLGFMPNNEPIVYKENNRYVVLEGNRRTTACKLLETPELLGKSMKARIFKTVASSINPDIVKNLTVIIAPNREAADVLIVNIHTQGSPVEKWDKTKQDRFFYNRHNDGETLEQMAHKFNLPKTARRDSIARHNMFVEILNLGIPSGEKLGIDETSFGMTTLERFYKSKLGRDFLGLDITAEGRIEHRLPNKEYKQRLSKIAKDVLDKALTSRTYGDEALQKQYLAGLKSDSSFDFSISLSKHYEEEYDSILIEDEETLTADTSVQEKPKKTLSLSAADHKLIPPIAYGWKTENTRINSIFKELQNGDLNKQFNAMAILFRSYLDMIVYQFLQKQLVVKNLIIEEQQKADDDRKKRIERMRKFIITLGVREEDISDSELMKALNIKSGVGKDWVPSLRQMLGYIASNEEMLPDVKLRQALLTYLKGNNNFLGHHDLNLLTHNEYYIKGKKELKDTWSHLYPILLHINSFEI